MASMGAKDALCKIAHLSIGLEDTLAYCDEASFSAGLRKTVAFQPRVIKQNRGSSGEGIWIVKLKKGNYCRGHTEMTSKQFFGIMAPLSPSPCLHSGQIHSTKSTQPPLLRLHLGNPLPPLSVDII